MQDLLKIKEKYQTVKESERNLEDLYNKKLSEMQKEIDSIHQQFHAQNSELIQTYSEAHVDRVKAENELREALIEQYKETGIKTFDKDLSVRVNQTIKYPMDAALGWAKTNAPFLLQEVLDKKRFESITKDLNPPLSFVEIEQTFSAVISKNI